MISRSKFVTADCHKEYYGLFLWKMRRYWNEKI